MVHSPKQNGFTLVEIVIVVACLSILVLSLVPQYNLNNINVEAATQRLEQDLRYARELALTRNVNCGIQFQANGNYTVYESTPASPTLNPLTQQSFSNYNLGNNFRNVNIVNLTGPLLVEFDPLGRPVSGANTTIQVGDAQTVISLSVTPSTGLVRRL